MRPTTGSGRICCSRRRPPPNPRPLRSSGSTLGSPPTTANNGKHGEHGETVFPEEVEEILKRHPAAPDAVIVGVPDDGIGEAITALAELNEW